MISKIKTFLRFKTKCFISRTGGCRFGCCLAVREEVVAPGGAEGLPCAGGEELGEGGGGVVQLEEGEAEGVHNVEGKESIVAWSKLKHTFDSKAEAMSSSSARR